MSAVLLSLPVVGPIMAAGASVVCARSRRAQRWIGLITLSGLLGVSVTLLIRADREGRVVTQAGGWPAPLGITLIVDRFSAAMLTVSALMLLTVLVYGIGERGAEHSPAFHPTYLLLAGGVAMSLVAGDLFNLFVAFEVMLSSSYLLLTLGGGAEQIRRGTTYVVISLLASMMFLTTLGLIYAATGTVNLADLTTKLNQLPAGTADAFRVLLFATFGIKAALFPLFFWLPDSYPTAPSPITAVFAGLLTKVGVYAIIRTQTLLRPGESKVDTIILVIAALTMVVGVLGAIAQDDIKRILSFHIVSQVGYMVMGLGFFTVAGLTGAVLYCLNQVVLKTTLLLTGGAVEYLEGTGRLSAIGGVVRRSPVIAGCFALSAASLAGIPPFSGFVAKFALIRAGFGDGFWWVTGVSIAVSGLTLFSMTKIWSGAFWGRPGADHVPARPTGPLPRLMGAPMVVLVAAMLATSVFAGPIVGFAQRAATDLLDPTGYAHAVLGTETTDAAGPPHGTSTRGGR